MFAVGENKAESNIASKILSAICFGIHHLNSVWHYVRGISWTEYSKTWSITNKQLKDTNGAKEEMFVFSEVKWAIHSKILTFFCVRATWGFLGSNRMLSSV